MNLEKQRFIQEATVPDILRTYWGYDDQDCTSDSEW